MEEENDLPQADLTDCTSFYQILLAILRAEKNCKLLHLLRILIQQITQTMTKNPELSEQMAYYTPFIRDVKYMFTQGGEIIGSKPLKQFVSFQPFLNGQQSQGVDSSLICESEQIIKCSNGIDPFLFCLINRVNNILINRFVAFHRNQGQDMTKIND